MVLFVGVQQFILDFQFWLKACDQYISVAAHASANELIASILQRVLDRHQHRPLDIKVSPIVG